jgi:hypothetical protein
MDGIAIPAFGVRAWLAGQIGCPPAELALRDPVRRTATGLETGTYVGRARVSAFVAVTGVREDTRLVHAEWSMGNADAEVDASQTVRW